MSAASLASEEPTLALETAADLARLVEVMTGRSAGTVRGSDRLVEDLALDSFDIAELAAALLDDKRTAADAFAKVQPREGLLREIATAGMGSDGTPISRVVILKRGTLPKTPSGKLQRFRCRQLAQNPPGSALVRDAGRV